MYTHTYMVFTNTYIHGVFAFNVLPNLPMAADFIISSDFSFP